MSASIFISLISGMHLHRRSIPSVLFCLLWFRSSVSCRRALEYTAGFTGRNLHTSLSPSLNRWNISGVGRHFSECKPETVYCSPTLIRLLICDCLFWGRLTSSRSSHQERQATVWDLKNTLITNWIMEPICWLGFAILLTVYKMKPWSHVLLPEDLFFLVLNDLKSFPNCVFTVISFEMNF